MQRKNLVTGLSLGLVLLVTIGLFGIWLKLPKFEVVNQSSLKKFSLSSLWENVYLWKAGYLFQVNKIKVVYSDEIQPSYAIKSQLYSICLIV